SNADFSGVASRERLADEVLLLLGLGKYLHQALDRKLDTNGSGTLRLGGDSLLDGVQAVRTGRHDRRIGPASYINRIVAQTLTGLGIVFRLGVDAMYLDVADRLGIQLDHRAFRRRNLWQQLAQGLVHCQPVLELDASDDRVLVIAARSAQGDGG